MKFTFAHNNLNVYDLEKSLSFYKEALGLTVSRTKDADDGSFKLVYLGDGVTPHLLELTWLRDWDRPYNLGTTRFILLSPLTILTPHSKSTKKWDASVLKIRRWGSISLKIRTDTGLRSCLHPDKYLPPAHKFSSLFVQQGKGTIEKASALNAEAFLILYTSFLLTANINHSALNRSDDNSHTFCRCMDHLAVSYVDTAVSNSGTHITGLRITYS